MSENSVLPEFLADLGSELQSLNEERSRLARIIRENTEQITKVNAKIDAISSISETLQARLNGNGAGVGSHLNGRIERKGATAAVLELLEIHPKGLTKGCVVEELQDRIDSDAEDRARVIYNTMLSLKRRGRIKVVNDDGVARYILPKFQEPDNE